jgi:short-subunit dehydrogenase
MEKEGNLRKISLVTGASSGLGRDIASLLCKEGHVVYVVARQKEKLLELQKECSSDAGKIKIIAGDLTDSKFRENLISQILKIEKKIDYLVNNAGFGRAIKFEEMNSDEIKNMFEVNVVAYEHLASLVLKSMKKRNVGRIINIGSVVVFTPLPYFTVYNSTKSAVYSFSRSLKYELKGSNITSTVVLPARMKTGFAEKAYDCYIKDGKRVCVERFNKIAGSSLKVAKVVVRKIDSGKEVITPTLKAKLWYFTRYFGWIVDWMMKNVLGPKELEHLEQTEYDEMYLKK